MHSLETERLRMRPYAPADLDLMAPLYADPDVTAFTKLGRRSRAQAEAILDGYVEAWQTRDFGMRALFRKRDGVFVGECGLFLLSGGEAALRYAVTRDHWGEGFTTEATAATLADAFDRVGLARVLSVVQAPNTASHRVMDKLGLTVARRDRDGDTPLLIYEMTAAAWRLRTAGMVSMT